MNSRRIKGVKVLNKKPIKTEKKGRVRETHVFFFLTGEKLVSKKRKTRKK